MENAETILVIFLSTALAVFLVLAIIATSFLIKILKSVKHITDKAEAVSDIIEESARSVGNVKFVSSIIGAIQKLNKNRKD